MAKKTKRRVRRKPLPGEAVGEINGFPIRRMRVSSLDPAAYNPREITERALGGLRASVGEFWLPQPIVWNKRTSRVVGGHQRLKTLEPDSETDVIVVDLGEVKEKALNIALNNPHAAGDWTDSLNELLKEIRVEIPDLAEDLLFDGLDIDLGLDTGGTGPEEPEKREPLKDPKGVWIIHGSCPEALRKLPDNSIHAICCSPPYWGLRDYKIEDTVWGGDSECEHKWGKKKKLKGVGNNSSIRGEDDDGSGPFDQSGVDPGSKREREHVRQREVDAGQFCLRCDAWRGCLGLEPTPELFLVHLVDVFREVRRVLRQDGTCWLNMGSSYASQADDMMEVRADLTNKERAYVLRGLAECSRR